MIEMRQMGPGLHAVLRLLQHELAQGLEHVDLRLEDIEDLDADGREVALEVAHALLEALELTKGYLLDALVVLGALKLEIAELPSPGGERTLAAVSLTPSEESRALLGLAEQERLFFDGVFTYLERNGAPPELWLEVGDSGPVKPSRLPVVP
jgi:hypothetical protein